MTLSEQTLINIGTLSAELAGAEVEGDSTRLAALVAACRSIEQRALASLAGKVTQGEILTAQVEALTALGW